MARFLLAWERGGGLGHAMTLARIAAPLCAAGHEVHVALRDLSLVPAAFGPLAHDGGMRLWQAPLWQAAAHGLPPPASYPELLFHAGYLEPARLAPLAQGWRSLLDAVRPAVLLADHAPTALLAARGRPGLRRVLCGNGFFMPPQVAPMPAFRDWEPVAPARLAASEARVLQTCNAVLHGLGAPPLPALHTLLDADLEALLSWPALDPYGPRAPQPRHLPLGPLLPAPAAAPAPAWPDGTGPRVFAYLKPELPGLDGVLQRLRDGPWRTLACVPGLPAAQRERLASPQLGFATPSLALAPAVAAAAVVLCHGGSGVAMEALAAGVPLVMLPMQAEQLVFARRVEAAGAGLGQVAADPGAALPALLDAALADDGLRAAAARLRASVPPGDAAAALAARCIALATG